MPERKIVHVVFLWIQQKSGILWLVILTSIVDFKIFCLQPFCDGTHRSPFLKIKLKPVRFVPTETKEYWFCNCKQTNNRPFCDGSHRDEEIQTKVKGN